MKNSKVGIVIVNWNGYQITRTCLLSCKSLNYKNTNIYVVDNGSTDGSVDKLKNEFPEVDHIENNENKGFAGGVNPGIQTALISGCEYVWLLNNDATPEPEGLAAMVEVAENEQRKCIVGSVIYKGVRNDVQKEVEVVGGGHINFFTGRSTINKKFGNQVLDYISGASMLIPRSVIGVIGSFDEAYFMYYEDVDFCYRAKRNGINLAVAENSHIWHIGSASTKGDASPVKDTYAAKSCVIFFKKYGRFSYLPAIVAMSVRSVRRVLFGQFGCVFAIARGFMQGVAVDISNIN